MCLLKSVDLGLVLRVDSGLLMCARLHFPVHMHLPSSFLDRSHVDVANLALSCSVDSGLLMCASLAVTANLCHVSRSL